MNCEDCKHYGTTVLRGPTGGEQAFICLQPVVRPSGIVLAADARAENGKCGPDALMFEEKD